jgi:nitrate reductase (NAD(P)H)
MSSLFDRLEIGHEIQLKGPIGSFTWLGKGEVLWKGNKYKPRSLGMICGGSGMKPYLRTSRYSCIFRHYSDATSIEGSYA